VWHKGRGCNFRPRNANETHVIPSGHEVLKMLNFLSLTIFFRRPLGFLSFCLANATSSVFIFFSLQRITVKELCTALHDSITLCSL